MIKPTTYKTRVLERRWLSEGTFELTVARPEDFSFKPGQKIQIAGDADPREYSIASAPTDPHLKLCIRRIEGGLISSKLCDNAIGSELFFQGPYGYFHFKASERRAVFVATGTGIAPFVSMMRSGVNDFILLHGVRQAADLYYRSELEAAAHQYLPFVSEQSELPAGLYSGRVTDFIKSELPQSAYDFYLCGGGAMIRDVIILVDERFEGSRVFSEKFY